MAKSFNNLPKDASRIAVARTGNAPAFQDGTPATPNKSPLTVSSAVITLSVPTNAFSCYFYATANDCRIAIDDATVTDHYFVLKAGQYVTIDLGSTNTLYLLRDAGSDATLQFIFNTI